MQLLNCKGKDADLVFALQFAPQAPPKLFSFRRPFRRLVDNGVRGRQARLAGMKSLVRDIKKISDVDSHLLSNLRTRGPYCRFIVNRVNVDIVAPSLEPETNGLELGIQRLRVAVVCFICFDPAGDVDNSVEEPRESNHANGKA